MHAFAASLLQPLTSRAFPPVVTRQIGAPRMGGHHILAPWPTASVSHDKAIYAAGCEAFHMHSVNLQEQWTEDIDSPGDIVDRCLTSLDCPGALGSRLSQLRVTDSRGISKEHQPDGCIGRIAFCSHLPWSYFSNPGLYQGRW